MKGFALLAWMRGPSRVTSDPSGRRQGPAVDLKKDKEGKKI